MHVHAAHTDHTAEQFSLENLTNQPLAIIVPAYKTRYLAETLDSIAAQSSSAFNIYVFDDCSDEPVADVCKTARMSGNLTYRRFSDNLGGKSLARHWNRCVELTTEPWVWLFSDDDIMESGCVAKLNERICSSEASESVLRFNTTVIDEQDNVVALNPPHPEWESPEEFLYFRLRHLRYSFAPEYVFRRRSFEEAGGFVEFPAAWCSDDASWCIFAKQSGIRTLIGPRVQWRMSSSNISGSSERFRTQKIEALFAFLEWLARSELGRNTVTRVTHDELVRLSRGFLLRHLGILSPSLGACELLPLAERIAQTFGTSIRKERAVLLRLVLERKWRDLIDFCRRRADVGPLRS